MSDPKRPDGCAECYWDDYAGTWRLQADCPLHGERVRKGCTHPEDEPCWPPPKPKPKPNHYFNDALGDPQTCTGDHNHPPSNASYRPPPSHYATGGIDPWAYIAAQGLDYWQGNVIKYVTRAGRKEIASKLDDLLKARDFLNWMIEREQENE